MTPISAQLGDSQVYLAPRSHTMHSDESAFHAYHTCHCSESARPHTMRAIPTSRLLYKSRRQNRIVITSSATLLPTTWTANFSAWNYRGAMSSACRLDIIYELDVTCIRDKNLAARRDCSPRIPNYGISGLKKCVFQLL